MINKDTKMLAVKLPFSIVCAIKISAAQNNTTMQKLLSETLIDRFGKSCKTNKKVDQLTKDQTID